MENATKKSFWQRPEGNTGMVFIALVAIAVVILFDRILPFFIRVLENTLYTMALIGVIGGIVVLLSNERFRTAVSTLFQLAMRALTGMVVEINPIGILKNHIRSLYIKIEQMDEHISALRGQITGLRRKISEKHKAKEESLARAEQYKKQGDDLQATLHARNAAREEDYCRNIQVHLDSMIKLQTFLDSLRGKSKFLLEDTEHTVNLKEDEYKAVRAAHSAVKAAKAFISGDKSQKEMFELAMQNIADEVATKIGDMENFMEISKEVLSGVDADVGILNDRGLKMLDAWEAKGGVQAIENVNKKGSPVMAGAGATTATGSPVDKYV